MKSKGIWIIAEQHDGKVLTVSYELLNRGRDLADKLGVDLYAIIFGDKIDPDGLNELIERGADKVIVVESSELKYFSLEPYSACLIKLIQERVCK